jgi:hypothetical protein
VKTVRKLIERNQENPAWAKLDRLWHALVDENRAAIGAVQRDGRCVITWEYQAQTDIVRLAAHVSPREIVETVLAIYVMAYQEPRRFTGDKAFMFQLVRRVRALTEANAGITWDHQRRRNKRVYRDLPPRATEHMGVLIVSALGASGVQIAAAARGEDRHTPAGESAGLAHRLRLRHTCRFGPRVVDELLHHKSACTVSYSPQLA